MTIDIEPLERIDSFPYRHRIRDVMSSPVAVAAPSMTIAEASRQMVEAAITSLIVVDRQGHAIGIVTEHDVVRAVASADVDRSVASLMSSPVVTVPADAYLFVAFGRMPRLGVRHLLVVDDRQRPVGMMSASVIMHLRAEGALVIGDEIDSAVSADALADVWRRTPALLRGLLAEGLAPIAVSAIVSAILRDLAAQAARLAEASMVADGLGPAPAPWTVLVLGSGGRGEATVTADQDHAIVYDGPEAHDAWFAELGRRMSDTLAAAGIPYCKGNVMASNAEWRRTLAGWYDAVNRWIREVDGRDLLNTDIFIDFRPVLGDDALAERVRAHLIDRASRHAPFLHALALSLTELPVPLSFFGELVTVDGRLSIKKSGLLPLVSTVRVLAVKHGIAATSTRERIRLLVEGGHLAPVDAERLVETHDVLLDVLYKQLLSDAERGVPFSNSVDPNALDAATRKRLRKGFRHIKTLKRFVETALSSA